MFHETANQIAQAASHSNGLTFLFGLWFAIGLPLLIQRIAAEASKKLLNEFITVIVIISASGTLIFWLLTQLP